MGFFSTAKSTVSQIFDFRVDRWADWQGIKNTTRYLWEHSKDLFFSKKSNFSETFEMAITRLEISNEDLIAQRKRYGILAVLFIFYAISLMLYGAIILFFKNWIGGIISFSLSIYALALAFRFHFWCFQIKQKKLGCTVREWYQSIVFEQRS